MQPTREFKVQHKKAVSWDLVHFSAPLFAASLVAWPMSLIPLVLGTKNLDGVSFYYNIAIALGSLSYTLVAAAETASLPVWSHQLAHGQQLPTGRLRCVWRAGVSLPDLSSLPCSFAVRRCDSHLYG